MNSSTNSFGQPIGEPVENWQPRPFPPATPIVGRYCQLEPLDARQHANELSEAFVKQTSDDQWTYLAYGPFETAEDFGNWLTEVASGNDPQFHSVIDITSRRAVGLASYLRIEPSIGVIEVGHIHFSPQLQRSIAATESMYLMMRRAFDELGYRRYEWKCDALNERSRNAALRLGFRFEGIFRHATMYKGRNRDTAWYAITDQDWPRISRVFETWLHTENFDTDGKQRRRLSEMMNNR